MADPTAVELLRSIDAGVKRLVEISERRNGRGTAMSGRMKNPCLACQHKERCLSPCQAGWEFKYGER